MLVGTKTNKTIDASAAFVFGAVTVTRPVQGQLPIFLLLVAIKHLNRLTFKRRYHHRGYSVQPYTVQRYVSPDMDMDIWVWILVWI
jgi:hypothetical protein